MKKIYNYFIIASFFCSFGMIIGCDDELQNSTSNSYIKTTDSLTTSIETSTDELELKGEQLDEAMEELSETFDNEF